MESPINSVVLSVLDGTDISRNNFVHDLRNTNTGLISSTLDVLHILLIQIEGKLVFTVILISEFFGSFRFHNMHYTSFLPSRIYESFSDKVSDKTADKIYRSKVAERMLEGNLS
jgi:hypothetical protein